MSINIIDGFYVGSPTPIDSRFVVANSVERIDIEYKYDGLKVFQLDTRETYIWNSTDDVWDLEGSDVLTGVGVDNYIPSWKPGSVLGTSSLYSSYPNIGLNNTNPLSLLDIKDKDGSGSLSLNVRRISASQDSAVIGYNWYYNSSDQRIDSLKTSTKIEFGSTGTVFSIQNRPVSSATWNPILELNNSSGFNYLRSPSNGNFISGSVSFSSSTTAFSSNNLVFVDGSFRTNSSSNVRTTYLTYNNLNFSKQSGYQANGSINSMVSVGSSPYNIDSNDNFIVVRTTTAVTNCSLRLPQLSASKSTDIGREITIQFDDQDLLNISNKIIVVSASSIVGLDGQNWTDFLEIGDTIKFVSILENTTPKWKVFQHIKYNRVETWKSIGTGGFMDNNQSIPSFSTNVSNRGTGFAPLRLRKVNSKYVHLQGNVSLSNLITLLTIISLPTGYRPVYDSEFPVIFSKSSGECFKGFLSVKSDGGVVATPGIGEITGAVNCNLAIDVMITLD